MTKNEQEYKQIRVFLSSTFKDMQQERDALVKLFRQLAEEGRKNRISITLLDLRWGITDDQRRNGMVISTCLQEIDNSRPFFIGLIGKRYGWVPSHDELKVADLLVKFPKLERYADKGMSITEIEMRYGVLESDSHIQSIFMQKAGIVPESGNHITLIRDIEKSEKTQLFVYASISQLVEQVRREFLKVIEEYRLTEDNVDPHEQEKRLQDRILYEKSEGYVPISNYKHLLSQWANGANDVLVVVGKSGSGRTSLIASWVNENAHRFDHVICYFIGEEGNGDSPVEIQLFIIRELSKRYDISTGLDQLHAPDTWDDDYVLELEAALKEVEKKNESLLLVIEGLDHLYRGVINKLLLWLPELPKGVKMLLSTSKEDGTYRAIVDTKHYPLLEMQDFSENETAEIINSILIRHGKHLDRALVDVIARNSLFQRGAVLKILLDDLLAYGIHEELPNQIKHYASATDVANFFELILERAEHFYGCEKTRALFLLLAISNCGLEEGDIQDILGLTPLEWSELYCGLRNHLQFTDGRYVVRYPDMCSAIESRYSNTEAKEIEVLRKGIIGCLSKREGEEAEIAWQAYCMEDIELLHQTLAPFETLTALLQKDAERLFLYWKYLEQHDYSFGEYLEVMPKDKEKIEVLIVIIAEQVDLYLNNPELAAAFITTYMDLLGNSHEDETEKADLLLFLGRLGNKHGQIDFSMDCAAEAKEVMDRNNETDNDTLCSYYLLIGNNFYACGDYEEALEAHQQALDYSRLSNLHEEIDTWVLLNRIGLDFMALKRYEEAIAMFEKAFDYASLIMTSASHEASQIINNIGYCYMEQGDYEKAETYLNKAVAQMKIIFEESNLELYLPLTNMVNCHIGKSELEKAQECLDEIMALLEANEMTTELQYSYVYLKYGEIQVLQDNYQNAIALFKKSIDALGEDYFMPEPYQALASAYSQIGDFKKAAKTLKTMEKRAAKF